MRSARTSPNYLGSEKYFCAMKSKMGSLALLPVLLSTLVACSSKSEDTGDSESGGGYIGCVLELTEARRSGIISATDQEIQEECRSQLLP